MPQKSNNLGPRLSPQQIQKIAMEVVRNAVKGLPPEKIIEKIQRHQGGKAREAQLRAPKLGYPQEVNGVSFLVPVADHYACSGGGRLMHWLAAMLAETGAAVATNRLCIYNPMLPVRMRALPTDIAILSDGSRYDPTGASRVFWWMLFFADAYFCNRVKKGEGCLVYSKAYLPSVQAACDYPVTEKDIFYLPHLDPQGCYPGRKTIDACIYGEEAANKSSVSYVPVERALNPHTEFNPTAPKSRIIPGAVMMPAKTDVFGDGNPHHEVFAHQRTLAILRASRNFYTIDHHTAMSIEAALCGCKVWYIQKSGPPQEQYISTADLERYVMNPARDVKAAEVFKGRVLKFFGLPY
jgi:hypothetical protein